MSNLDKNPERNKLILDEIVKVLLKHDLTLQEGYDILTYHAGGYFLARFITPRLEPNKNKIMNLMIIDCI